MECCSQDLKNIQNGMLQSRLEEYTKWNAAVKLDLKNNYNITLMTLSRLD